MKPRPIIQEWNENIYLWVIKGLARVGWWLQKPLIIEQRKGMTTVNMFTDVDDDEIESFIDSVRERTDSQVSQREPALDPIGIPTPCTHEHVTEPKYSGGNYGYYGFVRCLDCGAWKDDYSDWHGGVVPVDEGQLPPLARTLDVSTEEIKTWPKVQLRGTEPQWYQDAIKRVVREHQDELIERARNINPSILKPHVREALEQADAVRAFRERLEQAEPMIDTLTRDELEAAWPHLRDERLENERQHWLDRWSERKQRRLDMEAGLELFEQQEHALEHEQRLEHRRLERDSTMPPEAPQVPVSVPTAEDEWMCRFCGTHVNRTAMGVRFTRTYDDMQNKYVTTGAWCNNDHYKAWLANNA